MLAKELIFLMEISISKVQEKRLFEELSRGMTKHEASGFASQLSNNAVLSLLWMFEVWALKHQRPPSGDWLTWVVMGGRGAGKTRTGSEWVRAQIEGSKTKEKGRCSRVALVGETIDQVREVMIFGESGLLACSPPDRKPVWQSSRKQLVWPNGAIAQVFSASDPESLRGPQFDCAWLDEFAKWKRAKEAWDMLQFGLRLGDDPKQIVTTTPQNTSILKDILKKKDTVVTSAPTRDNRMNLAASFLKKVTEDYAGTRLGRQELEGELLEDVEGALWRLKQFDRRSLVKLDDLDRIIVAVDPPVTSGANADECGLIVAGVEMRGTPREWIGHILADLSIKGATPNAWAIATIEAAEKYQADRVVAEVNQGGEMVENILRQRNGNIPFRAVRASRGKVARAEPIAALYEQGRIFHVQGLKKLEDQMCQMTLSGFSGTGSPDRVDAMVWALTDLMITPAANGDGPRVRSI